MIKLFKNEGLETWSFNTRTKTPSGEFFLEKNETTGIYSVHRLDGTEVASGLYSDFVDAAAR